MKKVLFIFIIFISTNNKIFSQNIRDFSTSRSTYYSSLAYQVAKAVCPITASNYYCHRITNFRKNSDGTRRAYFYFSFNGQTSIFSDTTSFDLLLDIDIDDNNSLNYVYGGYEDNETKSALSIRRNIGEENYWGKIILNKTIDTDYKTVRSKAMSLYDYY